jgi:hypothetical protein
MDLRTTQDRLAAAEQRVADGDADVTRQRGRVTELQRLGHRTTEAKRLLQQLEAMQGLHIADRDRLMLAFLEKVRKPTR